MALDTQDVGRVKGVVPHYPAAFARNFHPSGTLPDVEPRPFLPRHLTTFVLYKDGDLCK
jgi:hypothetical protein